MTAADEADVECQMSYEKEIGGLEMKAVTFSKTDKTKIITFVLVTYGLPWLFFP